jgi:hypothetical protein
MTGTATVAYTRLAHVIQRMPSYDCYGSALRAAAEERAWRLALGRQLKECGDRLLRVVELQPEIITDEQHDTIDSLVDDISAIFQRLNRQGRVSLGLGDADTVLELEEHDLRLILLIEEAHALVLALARDARSSSWFGREALRLSRDLEAIGAVAEERNFLLGLGRDATPARTRPKGDEA